jgi:uncharacterized protein (DUF342 family)
VAKKNTPNNADPHPEADAPIDDARDTGIERRPEEKATSGAESAEAKSEPKGGENADQNNLTLFIRQGDQKSGFAEVTLAPDGMSAIATFYPSAPMGDFLTYPLVAERLDAAGIVYGVLHDAIQDAILKANSTRTPVRDVLIAQATRPAPEIPEHFVIRKDFLDRKPEIDPNAARIDWHSISAFSIVQFKEPIARRIPKVDGKPGTDIYGKEVPYHVERMQVFSAGNNVIAHDKGLFAGKSGRLSINSEGVVTVEDVLVLKKGVDFTTGNITFPGDVILSGKIADGFKIYASGSFVSSEIVDVTEIVCKKDMIIHGGIEGRTNGAVRVGGNLQAKFIQNCRVAVRGDIIVTGSIVQSTVYSMGTIKMGETGKLVGCECIVIGGVQAFDIGSPRGARTRVRCGTDFTVQQELDIANEQLKVIAIKLQRAEEMYKEEPLEDIAKHVESLRARRDEITARIPTFLPKIDRNDGAFIEVHGSIYPGTDLEICHVPYTVTKVHKAVVFRLDKSRGMIVIEPYKKQ